MNGIHMRRFRKIPPLQYLLGFEAAARLESFSKAAEELGLSASAVSHEMRLLEERIGQPLFIRQGRTIRLTDAGRDYHRSVMQALEQLESGFRRLEPYRKPGSVIIYCPSDFAARWLVPRLAALRREVPACEPWIDTSGKDVDFENLEVSIAITRGRAADDKRPTLHLFADELVPVAAQGKRFSAARNPADILHDVLIHDERPEGWNEWFQHAGVGAGDFSGGYDFSDREMALRACESGYGVALCTAAFTRPGTRHDSLQRISSVQLPTGSKWTAQTTEKELADNITAQAWQWLEKAIKSMP